MGRTKPKNIIILQTMNGSSPKVSFEIPGAKAQRIIDLIQSDIDKSNKKKQCTSITLDMFFTEKTND